MVVTHTIIPAEAGWALLDPIYGDAEKVDDFTLSPIVAWCVELSVENGDVLTYAYPVVADESPARIVIRRPDGSFYAPGIGDFCGKAQVIAFFNRE